MADTCGAVLPYGCNVLAVGGFHFSAVTTLAEAVNQNMAVFFGGNAIQRYFLAVGGFSFFGGNDFGGSGKPKYGGIFSAVMQYGGNCLAVMQYGGNFLAVSGF